MERHDGWAARTRHDSPRPRRSRAPIAAGNADIAKNRTSERDARRGATPMWDQPPVSVLRADFQLLSQGAGRVVPRGRRARGHHPNEQPRASRVAGPSCMTSSRSPTRTARARLAYYQPTFRITRTFLSAMDEMRRRLASPTAKARRWRSPSNGYISLVGPHVPGEAHQRRWSGSRDQSGRSKRSLRCDVFRSDSGPARSQSRASIERDPGDTFVERPAKPSDTADHGRAISLLGTQRREHSRLGERELTRVPRVCKCD